MKNMKKTKDRANPIRKDKNIMINGICLLLGVIILALGIAAPKTILAMMDKGELNKLYVREVDTDLQADKEPLSVEEKLALLCEDVNVSVSTSRQQSDDRTFEKKLLKMADREIRTLQERNIIPEIDLGEYDEETGCYYQMNDGSREIYSCLCECFSVVNLDNMNRYVSVAMLQYERDGRRLSLLMDTDTGKIYDFAMDNYIPEEEAAFYTQENVKAAVCEYLGISENGFSSYYFLDVWEVPDYETDASVNKGDVWVGMSLALNMSEQVSLGTALSLQISE